MPVSALYDRTRSELQRSTTNNANSTSSSTPLPLSHDHSSNCHPKPLLHSTNTTLPQYTPVLSFPFLSLSLSLPFPHTKPFLPSLIFLLSSWQQREIATTVGSPRTREFAVKIYSRAMTDICDFKCSGIWSNNGHYFKIGTLWIEHFRF